MNISASLIILLLSSSLVISQSSFKQYERLTMNIMIMYADSCYNDSIDLRPDSPCGDSTTIMNTMRYAEAHDLLKDYIPHGLSLKEFNYYIGQKKIRYIHKQPTFDGFYKWLVENEEYYKYHFGLNDR